MNADPIVTTASAATIRIIRRLALEHAYGNKPRYRAERLLDIANIRKRYDKKWQHQL
jgi:hypothetical protein